MSAQHFIIIGAVFMSVGFTSGMASLLSFSSRPSCSWSGLVNLYVVWNSVPLMFFFFD